MRGSQPSQSPKLVRDVPVPRLNRYREARRDRWVEMYWRSGTLYSHRWEEAADNAPETVRAAESAEALEDFWIPYATRRPRVSAEMTLDEIGAELGISATRVAQIIAHALRKLRESLRREQLRRDFEASSAARAQSTGLADYLR